MGCTGADDLNMHGVRNRLKLNYKRLGRFVYTYRQLLEEFLGTWYGLNCLYRYWICI